MKHLLVLTSLLLGCSGQPSLDVPGAVEMEGSDETALEGASRTCTPLDVCTPATLEPGVWKLTVATDGPRSVNGGFRVVTNDAYRSLQEIRGASCLYRGLPLNESVYYATDYVTNHTVFLTGPVGPQRYSVCEFYVNVQFRAMDVELINAKAEKL